MKTKVRFPKEPDFFYKELSQEVLVYFDKNTISKYGNRLLVLKYIVLKALFFSTYLLIFYAQQRNLMLLLFSILGILGIILAINVGHDAIHGIAHSKKWINSYFKMQLDFI